MPKKILYLEDLYSFYSKLAQSVHYSANDNNGPLIVVQTHGKMKFDTSDPNEGLTKVHLRACHTDANCNQSSISIDVMNKALPSFKNRPILGYIHEVDGEPQFERHNIHLDDNDEVVYDERPIGIIPESNNAKIVYDDNSKKSYVEVDGYIFDEYSKAKQILERDAETACSVELSIRDLSYNAKDKILEINDFFFSGVTALGIDDEGNKVEPGMEGANITLSDFTVQDTKIDFSNQIIEMQEKLDTLLSHFDIEQSSAQGSCEKGGTKMEFENKENMESEVTEQIEDDSQPEVDETEAVEVESADEETDEQAVDEESRTDDIQTEQMEFHDPLVRTFEISHEDIRCALYALIAPYESANDDYYWIYAVYDDYFAYQSMNTGSYFGLKYSKDGDNVALEGEPYNLHQELLTDSEYAKLNEMRSNYEALVEFKNTTEQNELHSQRMFVMTDEKYSIVSNKDKDGNFVNKSYASLYEDMDKYSCDELNEKLKAIVGEYAINGGKFESTQKEKTKTTPIMFTDVNSSKNKKGKYGTLKFN